MLSANSIKKWQLKNDEGSANFSQVESFIITNAEDLNSTDFACMVSQQTLEAKILFTEFDKSKKTLKIFAANSTIDLSSMKDIYFGDSSA